MLTVSVRSLVDLKRQGANDLRVVVDSVCWDLEAALEGVRGVSVKRKGLTAVVDYEQAPPHLDNWIETTVRLTMRPYANQLRLKSTGKAWKLRPRVDYAA